MQDEWLCMAQNRVTVTTYAARIETMYSAITAVQSNSSAFHVARDTALPVPILDHMARAMRSRYSLIRYVYSVRRTLQHGKELARRRQR